MKKFTALSFGDKVFVIVVLLLCFIAAVATVVAIIYSPVWQTSIINGVCCAFTLGTTVGVTLWFFIEMLLKFIK